MDFVAGFFELCGAWLVGNKNKWGFFLLLIGCLLWIVVVLQTHVYGLLVVVVPALGINIRNYLKWNKENT